MSADFLDSSWFIATLVATITYIFPLLLQRVFGRKKDATDMRIAEDTFTLNVMKETIFTLKGEIARIQLRADEIDAHAEERAARARFEAEEARKAVASVRRENDELRAICKGHLSRIDALEAILRGEGIEVPPVE